MEKIQASWNIFQSWSFTTRPGNILSHDQHKHISNRSVTFVTLRRFAALFFLPFCCVNSRKLPRLWPSVVIKFHWFILGRTVNSSFVNPPSCETTRCRYGKVCKIRYGKPKCLCPSCHTPDLKRHQPVCGTDGNTYNNECEFRRMTCKNGGLSHVEIDYEGSCQSKCNCFLTE